MKTFIKILLSDSNKISMKRFIGLISLAMFMSYGIVALFKPFNQNFWIFYVSLCTITIWIAFKFMSSDKILKYDVIGKLSKFSSVKSVVEDLASKESDVDPDDSVSGTTTSQVST